MLQDELLSISYFTIVVVLDSSPKIGYFSPSLNVGEFLEDFVGGLNKSLNAFEYFKDSDK
jgi:hypothetical protein